jgi:anti-sigma factor RsiW
MSCPLEFDKSAELIIGYCARTLDPDTTATFARHMESCTDCSEAVALQKTVWAALDEWSPVPVSPDFDQRLFQRIATTESRSRWLWQALVPAVACLILAVLLWKQPNSTPGQQSIPGQQIEQVEHALDDMDLLNQIGPSI